MIQKTVIRRSKVILILQKKKVTSNASRKITFPAYDLVLHKLAPRVYTRLLGTRGRSAQGRIICWTKGSVKKRKLKTVRILHSWKYLNLGFFATLKLTPRNNRLLGLVILSCGSYFYAPITGQYRILNFIYFKPKHKFRIDYLRKPIVFKLFMVRRLRKISMLEIYPNKGIQYATSAGCCAKIIKFSMKHHIALLALPSGVKKIFSVYVSVYKKPTIWKNKRRFANTKSGYWRNIGWKSTVRGVAMNPIDHPHGGRTNSIKYPRTPWGLTTKYK